MVWQLCLTLSNFPLNLFFSIKWNSTNVFSQAVNFHQFPVWHINPESEGFCLHSSPIWSKEKSFLHRFLASCFLLSFMKMCLKFTEMYCFYCWKHKKWIFPSKQRAFPSYYLCLTPTWCFSESHSAFYISQLGVRGDSRCWPHGMPIPTTARGLTVTFRPGVREEERRSSVWERRLCLM